MYKAVFFDIDGTLVSKGDLSITPKTKEAIQRLKDNNIKVGVATGRHMLEVKEINLLQDLTFDFYVMLNGGLCYDKDKLVYDVRIHPEDIHQLLELSKTEDIPVMLIEENDMYVTHENEAIRKAQAYVHTSIPPIKPYNHNNPIYQMCAYPQEQQAHLLDQLTHCDLTQWHPLGFDIVPKGGSKTKGIEAVLSPYHITLEEVVCFGDGNNDCEMLQDCGLGIAMANGSQKAIAAANQTCPSPEEDGIYIALTQLNLI